MYLVYTCCSVHTFSPPPQKKEKEEKKTEVLFGQWKLGKEGLGAAWFPLFVQEISTLAPHSRLAVGQLCKLTLTQSPSQSYTFSNPDIQRAGIII